MVVRWKVNVLIVVVIHEEQLADMVDLASPWVADPVLATEVLLKVRSEVPEADVEPYSFSEPAPPVAAVLVDSVVLERMARPRKVDHACDRPLLNPVLLEQVPLEAEEDDGGCLHHHRRDVH